MKTPETIAESPVMTVEVARASIMEIRQRVAVMGANDSEFWSLDQVLEKLDKGELIPETAVEEANSILDGKQDYH